MIGASLPALIHLRPAGKLLLATVLGALFLAGCQNEPMGGPLSLQVGAKTPVGALQHINEAGAKCWFRSRDRDFQKLQLTPELDTRTGKPRLLLLNAGKGQGLPVLVIEAAGSPVTIQTYGPLAATKTGARVNADIMRWSSGPANCKG